MKIGLVFDDSLDSTDGVAQYLLSLADWLRGQGHEVHYLVGETHRADLPNLHSLSRNVRVTFNGNRLGMPLPASSAKLRQLLQEQQFDVLHVMLPYSPLMAGKLIKNAGPNTKIVGTFHIAPYSWLATLGSRLLGLWCRRQLAKFSAVVSVSSAAQEFARKTFGLHTRVVPNMFDYQYYASAKPFKERLQLVFLGRLVARKGCQTLLRAVNHLHKNGQNVRLTICGDGELRPSLEAYVKEHTLSRHVTFAGRVTEQDKARYFASSSLSIFPSSGGESFGIVLLEAMASGQAAVLGGNNPGYRTVLGGQSELLFPATDHLALANKITELLEDDSKRQKLAEWGKKESAKYDKNVVGPQLLKLYKTGAA
ncbi:glycosyltransferase family 4 protein [Candidatus Saccharibacteria bacterium]|nr:glycosyltransferase family 4 protein [Candidatus Saccharibacteria bacterium]